MRGRETDDGREKRNAKGGRRSSFGQGAEEVSGQAGETRHVRRTAAQKNRNAALLTRAAQGGA